MDEENNEFPVAHFLFLAWADWIHNADRHYIEHALRARSFWDFLPASGRSPLPHLHKTTTGAPTTNFRLAMVETYMSGNANERGLYERNPKLHQVLCAKYLGVVMGVHTFSEYRHSKLLFPGMGAYAHGTYRAFLRAGWRTLAAYIASQWDDIEKLGYLRTLFGRSRTQLRAAA